MYDLVKFEGRIEALEIHNGVLNTLGGAGSLAQHPEVCFEVAVTVSLVNAERALCRRISAMLLLPLHDVSVWCEAHTSRLIEAFGKSVGLSGARGGEGAPSASVVPLTIAAGCIDVNAHVDTVDRTAVGFDDLIDKIGAIGERGLTVVRDIDDALDATSREFTLQKSAYLTRVLVLTKPHVGRAFARHIAAMGSAKDNNFTHFD